MSPREEERKIIKREEKENKGKPKKKKKGRKEGERRRSCKSSNIVASLEDTNLIPHTTRGEGSFLFGYFLVWSHGNGIWLSLLCDCLKE